MPPATFDETTVDITAGDYLFRVKGTVPKFAGWMATYGLTPGTEQKKPASRDGRRGRGRESVVRRAAAARRRRSPRAEALRPEQKFTQPPPRFTEATLVKELEENGIGRPSTYASIIGVLQDRDYVEQGRRAVQADRARPDHHRPAHQELRRHPRRRVHAQPRRRSRQDRAGQGRLQGDARRVLQEVQEGPRRAPARRCRTSRKGIKTDEVCDRCGKAMVIKVGKFGPFIACSGYPDCTNTRELEKSEPESETGENEDRAVRELRQADGRQARPVRPVPRVHRYPECKTTRKLIATKQGGLKAAKPDQILDEKCPRVRVEPRDQAGALRRVHRVHELSRVQVRQAEDHGRDVPEGRGQGRRNRRAEVAPRQGLLRLRELSRTATSCSGTGRSPKPCPDCGAPFLVEKITKKHGRQLICSKEDCDYSRSEELPETAA